MRSVRVWFARLGELVFKQRRDVELAAEMESHLQMHIEDSIRAGIAAGGSTAASGDRVRRDRAD